MYQIACVEQLHTRYFLFRTSTRKKFVHTKRNDYFCSEINF